LIRSGRLPAGSVLLRFVGHCQDGALGPADVVERATAQGWLDLIVDHLPRAAAVQMAQSADGLFLVQPHSATQVPGKLFEYIRIGRPILAFIQRASPIDRILAACGIPSVCIYPDDSPERCEEAVLQFLAIGSGPWKPTPCFERNFNGINQAKALCALIEESITRKG
jgi:hypothetical protein